MVGHMSADVGLFWLAGDEYVCVLGMEMGS